MVVVVVVVRSGGDKDDADQARRPLLAAHHQQQSPTLCRCASARVSRAYEQAELVPLAGLWRADLCLPRSGLCLVCACAGAGPGGEGALLRLVPPLPSPLFHQPTRRLRSTTSCGRFPSSSQPTLRKAKSGDEPSAHDHQRPLSAPHHPPPRNASLAACKAISTRRARPDHVQRWRPSVCRARPHSSCTQPSTHTTLLLHTTCAAPTHTFTPESAGGFARLIPFRGVSLDSIINTEGEAGGGGGGTNWLAQNKSDESSE